MPELSTVLRRAIDEAFFELRVATLAEVVFYNPSDHTVNVTPLLKRVKPATADTEEHVRTTPQLLRVPVLRLGGNGFRVDIPLAAGDQVLVLFCDENIDRWFHTGAEADPCDVELHGLGGAIAIPSVLASPNVWAGSSNSQMMIGTEAVPMRWVNGHIQIGGNDAAFVAIAQKVAENLSAISDYLGILDGVLRVTPGIVANGSPDPLWVALQAALSGSSYPIPTDTAATILRSE